jgi:hypothetical protein
MGDIANLITNDEFVADLARFAEGILDEKFLRKKYRLAESDWEALGSNDALVEQIELEKIRRVRSGAAKREKAQQLVTKAPDVLSDIMLDAGQSAKHRIDSAKVLDTFSGTGPQGAPAAERFQITIVLSADEKIRINKSKAVNPNDVAPVDGEIIDHDDDIDTAQGFCAAIATRKNDGGGGGAPR